jgi:ribokinase
MTESPRILVVGSLNVDLVAFADRLPDPGETLAGTRFLQGFGGKGANQAVMAARFGVAVSFVGAVGDDPNGRATLENLRREAIEIEDVAIVPATTGVASIWVDGAGMNRIVIVEGANGAVDPERAAMAVGRVRPSVVVGQFEIPQAATARAFAAARAVGATTILNPAPGAPIDPDLLASCDWIAPNETEFVAIGGRPFGRGDAGIAIDELGARLGVGLIVTLGERGVASRAADGRMTVIAAPAAEVVDTTGAGDAFVGAFAAGLALGWAPERAARLGCAAASDSVTRAGTQASFATHDQARRILATL